MPEPRPMRLGTDRTTPPIAPKGVTTVCLLPIKSGVKWSTATQRAAHNAETGLSDASFLRAFLHAAPHSLMSESDRVEALADINHVYELETEIHEILLALWTRAVRVAAECGEWQHADPHDDNTSPLDARIFPAVSDPHGDYPDGAYSDLTTHDVVVPRGMHHHGSGIHSHRSSGAHSHTTGVRLPSTPVTPAEIDPFREHSSHPPLFTSRQYHAPGSPVWSDARYPHWSHLDAADLIGAEQRHDTEQDA